MGSAHRWPKTVSGLALEALEAFPSARTSVRIEGYQLEIEDIARRILIGPDLAI